METFGDGVGGTFSFCGPDGGAGIGEDDWGPCGLGDSGNGIGPGDEGIPPGTTRGVGIVDVVELFGLLKSATRDNVFFCCLILFLDDKL